MTEPARPANAVPQPKRSIWMRSAALALLAIYAVALLAIMIVAGMPRDLADLIGILPFFAWAVAPVAAACVFIYRSQNEKLAIFAALITLLVAVSGICIYLVGMFGPGARSTSALIFLFLPLYQWGLPLLLLCAAGIVSLINVPSKRDRL